MILITNNSIFGENLKYLRESNGFTSKYMAKLLNISEAKLNLLETGRCLEVDDMIIRILQSMLGNNSVSLLEERIFTIDPAQ